MMIVRNRLRRSQSRPSTPDIHFPAPLPDGGRVILRPLQRGETAPQITVLERMSAESRWERFLTPVPARVPAALLTVLGEVDGYRHVAWLATVDGLLEGESDLRLPDPPRVDRASVIASHQAQFGGGLHDRAAVG